jgi:hypothetical protein
LLPDVAKFSVKLNEINPLLFTHGLQTRFGSMKTLVKGRNRSINRYLTSMYVRLLRSKSNPTRFWVIAMTLICRSHGYLVATFHHLVFFFKFF